MNAFELYDAVFDSAREEFHGTTHAERVQDVIDYADGALDMNVSRDVAEKIVVAHESYKGIDEDNGDYENAFYHKIRAPLEEIEL